MLHADDRGLWTILSADPQTRDEWAAAHRVAQWAWNKYEGSGLPRKPHPTAHPSTKWSLAILTRDALEANQQWSATPYRTAS